MRLDKFLSNSLGFSRSEIKKYIKYGQATINGKVIKDSSYQVKDTDTVLFRNIKVSYSKYIYIVLNKPSGVVSATQDNFDKTVIDLLSDNYKNRGLFPVGRLDKDTLGLLILTNDGSFAHDSLSPKKHVSKKYLVHVDGPLTKKDVQSFYDGITIDKTVLLKSAVLEIVESSDTESICYVTISEGKFHQIKKMFLTLDRTVTFLKRVSFGNFDLPSDLDYGEYRELTTDEISSVGGNNE